MSIKATSVPTKQLAASITSSALAFRLNNILGWDNTDLVAGDFGTQAFGVFRNASKTQLEIFEFDPATIASSTITILKRGLDFTGDLTTEVPANKLPWTKGDTYVDLGTDTPQLWQWIKEYIDGIAIAGSPDASTTAKGLVEEATLAEVLAETAVGATGARLFVNPSSLTFCGCRIYQNASTTIGNVNAIVLFQVENFDTDAFHDNVTNNSRITIPSGKAGKYHIGTSVDISGSFDSKVSIKLNGATYLAKSTGSANTDVYGCAVSTIYDLAVGDYVEVEARANNVGANTSGNAQTNFWAYKI